MKIQAILIASLFPMVVIAGGNDTHGHDMESMEHASHHMEHSDHMQGQGHSDDDLFGRPGDPNKVDRTVQVDMLDTMRFKPNKVQFKTGETVRFVVHNDGKIRHEMVIGTLDELKEHEAMMRNNPGMKHDEPNMISLAPGKQSQIIWQFDRAGSFEFACLQPGHFEAGMFGRIKVK